MTSTWAAVLLGSAACFLLKLVGYAVPASFVERPLVRRLVAAFPIALLSALLAVMTFGAGQSLTVDARVVGVAVAAVALSLRAPFLLVVGLAAAAAALARLLGWAV